MELNASGEPDMLTEVLKFSFRDLDFSSHVIEVWHCLPFLRNVHPISEHLNVGLYFCLNDWSLSNSFCLDIA